MPRTVRSWRKAVPAALGAAITLASATSLIDTPASAAPASTVPTTTVPTTTVPATTADPGTGVPGSTAVGAAPKADSAPAPSLTHAGYWLATTTGAVEAFGGTAVLQSIGGVLHAPIVGATATPDGAGYWLVASDGGIFSFGDASFYGSTGAVHLAKPVVGMASTPDGRGYWLVAADGGIFSFGDASFFGSTGGIRLTQPVVGMTSTHDGRGYWLVASDGGIFTFGDGNFDGSTGGIRLARPINGMATTPDGRGYWLVASDGGIFSFGDAPYYGSTGGAPLGSPVVALVPVPERAGYWLVESDGTIHDFGAAPAEGDAGASLLAHGSVVAAAPGAGTGVAGGFEAPPAGINGPPRYASGSIGYDISWPQCGGAYPPASGVAVVGVNAGATFSTNWCLASEAAWAGAALSLYINLDAPDPASPAAQAGPAGTCTSGDAPCAGYNWGYHAAVASEATAADERLTSDTWWLDVEIGNTWSTDTSANAAVIAGATAALQQAGHRVAVYSTSYQWGVIAGGYRPGLPVWYPTGEATSDPSAWCTPSSFTGGPVEMVQDSAGAYDGDYSC